MFKIRCLIVICFLIAIGCNNKEESKFPKSQIKGRISMSGAFALYPMALKWKEEYNKIYPDVKIDISAGGAGKGIADAISGIVDIGMVSREISQIEVNKGAWAIPVVKDAVVGVINTNNPVLKDILQRGMTEECLEKIFITGEIITWGQAIGDPERCKKKIQVYTRSDACGAADIWAKYLGKKQEDLIGVGVFGDPGIAQAVQNDLFGIGYNNIGFAFNPKTKLMNERLVAIPLDINNNNVIDHYESFYEHQDSIVNAIARNIYPAPPARDLYLVSKGKPVNPVVLHFLNWILTEGQKYVSQSGYIELTNDKLKKAIDKLR
jgi:phosphate transport system substrate-binding protein